MEGGEAVGPEALAGGKDSSGACGPNATAPEGWACVWPRGGIPPFLALSCNSPAPGLMASRCWAPRRGHRPHPKPQPWLLPEGPSWGDLVQAWAKRAHTPGSREVGKRTMGSLIPSMGTWGSKRCPSTHAHPQVERSLLRNPGEHICESWRQPRPFLATPPHTPCPPHLSHSRPAGSCTCPCPFLGLGLLS